MKAAVFVVGLLGIQLSLVHGSHEENDSYFDDTDTSSSEDYPLKVRRSVLGELKDVASSESELVRELSEFAVKTLDEVDDDNVKRAVVDIIDAKKQLVNGIMYHLELKVQDTACLEDQDLSYDDSCLSRTTNNPKICKIRVHRSFADKSPHNAKVVSSECNDEYEFVGDVRDAKSNSGYVKDMATFAIQQLNTMSNSLYWFKLVEILEAKTQVTGGISTYLTLELHSTNCMKHDINKSEQLCGIDPEDQRTKMVCHVVVWDQPWKKKVQIKKSTCSTIEPTEKPSTKTKRSLLGGEMPSENNDKKLEQMKRFLTVQLTARSNSDYVKRVVDVLNSTVQIVSGTLTKATVRVADTTCLKTENRNPNECTISSKGHQICYVSIFEQPWLNKKELTQSECHAIPSTNEKLDTSKEEISEEDWRHSVTSELRNHLILKLIRAVYPNATSQDISDQRLSNLVCYATKQENDSYDMAGSRFEYYEILARKIYAIEKELAEKRQRRREQREQENVVEQNSINHQQVPLKVPQLADILGVSPEDKELLDFMDFMFRHKRMYESNKEIQHRFRIFRANMMKAAYLNKTEQGTAWYGATMFADMTKTEFKKYTGLVYDPKKRPARPPKMAHIPDIELPTEFDWRDYNAVTPVKNQGMCGSCWAFSVTGNIEGLNAIANKTLISLSEQELVDCDKLDSGCNGGFFNTAFESIEKLGGLEAESDYPYEGHNEQCHLDKSEIRVTISDYVNITSDEVEMAKYLVAHGPISIALNANAMQFYMGGVSHPLRFLCDPDNLDHGVLIVGFGIHRYPVFHKTLPFWLIKNSWGEQWGVQGYYMAYRGDGTCGLNRAATSAIL